MIDKLKAYGWMTVAVLATAIAAIQTYRLMDSKLDVAAAAVASANQGQKAAVSAAAEQATIRKTENSLQQDAADIRTNTNDQVQALSSERDALLVRVRRAEAAASAAKLVSQAAAAPGAGQAPSGDAGAGLLATIGEPDVAEATRANVIRLHLAACYTQYDKARDALKASDW